jgi:type I restriction enzyme, S subunit
LINRAEFSEGEGMSEWKEVRLGDICDIYDGPHATPPKQSSGCVFLGISSIGFDGKIDPSQFEYISEDFYTKWTRRITPQAEDIVFSYETKLGAAALLPKDFKCCLGRRMGLMRIKSDVIPSFLLYAYLAPDFQKTIYERTIHGSTVDRIPLKDFPDFPINIPPLPEQKAIASILSSLDDKIDLLHRQNKTLEAIAETLFRQWFVEDVGKDWVEGKIMDLFVLQRGFDLPSQNRIDGKYPIFAASGFSGGHHEYRIAAPGVTTGRSGLLGKVFFVLDDFWPLNTSLFIKEFKIGTPLFSYFMLKTIDLESFNAGSAVPTLNRNHLHNLILPIPPKDLINDFEMKMMPNFVRIKSNQIQIGTLEKLRDTLLPKLMSGEVRVEI